MATIDQANIRGSEPHKHDPSGAGRIPHLKSEMWGHPNTKSRRRDEMWAIRLSARLKSSPDTKHPHLEFAGDSELRNRFFAYHPQGPAIIDLPGRTHWRYFATGL
jgi:hypothetical protein